MKKFILRAIAQVTPNKAGIEAPSKIENIAKVVSEKELNEYHKKLGLVSKDKDGVSNAKPTETWQDGVNGRYIVDGELPPGYRTD